MKPYQLLKSALAIMILAISSCSLPKMAQQSSDQDDVYITKVEAKPYVEPLQTYQESTSNAYSYNNNYDQEDYEYYGMSDHYYGMDYSSRLNNFYGGGLWRPYYNNDYYGAYSGRLMPWYSPSISFGLYYGSPFGYYNPWYNSYRYGFYNRYNGYFGLGYPYYIGGGYYGGGGIVGRPTVNPNYGPRPNRGYDNMGIINPNIGNYSNGRPINSSQGRPTNTTPQRTQANPNSTTRPARENTTPPPRPAQIQQRPSTPPPSNNSGGSRTQSSGSSSGRPTRGGR